MVDVGSTTLSGGFLAMGNFLHESFSPECFSYSHQQAMALRARRRRNFSLMPPPPHTLRAYPAYRACRERYESPRGPAEIRTLTAGVGRRPPRSRFPPMLT